MKDRARRIYGKMKVRAMRVSGTMRARATSVYGTMRGRVYGIKRGRAMRLWHHDREGQESL